MRVFNIMKVRLLAALLAVSLLTGGTALFAAPSSAKQLEKGIQLYQENRDEEAMDYLIDVLVNGSRAEVEEANKYINLIHNRIGGINRKSAECRQRSIGQKTGGRQVYPGFVLIIANPAQLLVAFYAGNFGFAQGFVFRHRALPLYLFIRFKI